MKIGYGRALPHPPRFALGCSARQIPCRLDLRLLCWRSLPDLDRQRVGEPDTGAILVYYIGSFLMAGAYLAIGSCLSAATKNR